MTRENETLKNKIIENANMIAAILDAAEEFVNDRGESSYSKEMAKVTAYDHIIEIVKRRSTR